MLDNSGALTIDRGVTYQPGPGNRGTGTAATLIDTGVLTNTGTLLDQGTLLVGGDLANRGSLSVDPGASLTVTGVLTNAGSTTLNGGRYTTAYIRNYGLVRSYYGGPSVTKVSGSLVNTGSLLLYNGAVTLAVSGTLTNIGRIDTHTYGPTPSLISVADTGVLSNAGIIDLEPVRQQGFFSYDLNGAHLENAGRLRNTGTILIGGAVTSNHYRLGGAQLNNTGLLVNSGSLVVQGGERPTFSYYSSFAGAGGTLTDSGVLRNLGSLTIAAGQPNLDELVVGPVPPIYYTYVGGLGGQMTVSGTLDNGGRLTVQGGDAGGGFALDNAATLSLAGVLSNSGTVVVGGGGGTVGGQATYTPPGALLDDTGSLLNSGTLIVANGTYNPGVASQGGTLDVGGALANTGTLLLLAGGGSGGTLVDSGILSNTGMLRIDRGLGTATLTVTATGTLADRGTITGMGTLSNSGLVTDGGGDAGRIDATRFINDGTVQITTGGTFLIGSTVSADPGQGGDFAIGAGGTLTLLGAIGADETATFDGAAATLALNDAVGFAGMLSELQDSSVIDLLGLTATAATATATTLSVSLLNGSTLELALAQPLGAGLTPHLTQDGHGGTDIVFHGGP